MKKNTRPRPKASLILPSDLSPGTRAKLYAFVDSLLNEMPNLPPRLRAGIMKLQSGALSFVVRGKELEHFDRWFWTLVKRNEQTACWEWQGRRDANGYGVFKIGGERMLAHRASLILLTGWDSELDSLHHCDNPPCVSPFHLYWGTHRQNMLDRLTRVNV